MYSRRYKEKGQDLSIFKMAERGCRVAGYNIKNEGLKEWAVQAFEEIKETLESDPHLESSYEIREATKNLLLTCEEGGNFATVRERITEALLALSKESGKPLS